MVPISRDGTKSAEIKLEDYEYLMSLGVSPNWQMTGGSVSARTPRGQRLVGRVLLGVQAGEKLQYNDGNPLNLRRSNLSITEGFSVQGSLVTLSGDPIVIRSGRAL